jgi:hypothetical protein
MGDTFNEEILNEVIGENEEENVEEENVEEVEAEEVTEEETEEEGAEEAENTGEEEAPEEGSGEKEKSEKSETVKKDTNTGNWKIKVGGEEREVTEEEARKRLQLELAADKKFKEASQIRQDAEQFIDNLKDPEKAIGFLNNLGVNIDELAQKRLYEKIKYEQMPEHERKALQAEKQANQYKSELDRYKTAEQQQAYEQQVADYQEQWKSKITNALETAKVPVNNYTISRMAGYVSQDTNADLKNIAEKVDGDYNNIIKDRYSNLDGESLYNMLGKDTVKKIREYELSKVKNNQTKSYSNPNKIKVKKKKDKGLSREEFRRQMDEIAAGL